MTVQNSKNLHCAHGARNFFLKSYPAYDRWMILEQLHSFAVV